MIIGIKLLILIFHAKCGDSFWPLPYKVTMSNYDFKPKKNIRKYFLVYIDQIDLEDHDTFVIELGNDEVNDENEMEMIKLEDLPKIQPLEEDDSKYKPLHSHVEHYNRRAAEIARIKSKNLPKNSVYIKEINVNEPRPYIADFRHNIEKFNAESRARRQPDKTITDSPFNDTDQYEEVKQTTVILGSPVSKPNDEPNNDEVEEYYDYDAFKAEYYQQLEDAEKNNRTFNYTGKDKPDYTPKDALKNFIEFETPKNCTKAELTEFGLKGFQCLVFDYKHVNKPSDVKKILWRTWMVLKIWMCIYICIAIPCWCQRGWCCCCCRCDFCFPRRRIRRAKKYFALNPPGVFVQQPKKGQPDSAINYEPTVLEIDAYRYLESQIRNL